MTPRQPDGVEVVKTQDGLDFYGACALHGRCSHPFSAGPDPRSDNWAVESARGWRCPMCEVVFTQAADNRRYAALAAMERL